MRLTLTTCQRRLQCPLVHESLQVVGRHQQLARHNSPRSTYGLYEYTINSSAPL
ncbi:hypothetical protein K523DRAFT_377342 [Schizophyllum commune Tattone D]|nr:hypothetical protein K523DRAFT_377342 [Schizophyllum commune Tattone D]